MSAPSEGEAVPAVSDSPRLERRGRLFVSACAGIFVFGIVMALLGTLFGLPEMRARLGISLVQQGDLLLLLFAGIWLSTIFAGPLLDRFGSRLVLAVAALLVTAALAEFALAHSFRTAGLASVTLGFGGGGLNTATNVLVSDLYGDQRGPMLNILGIFYGIGALFIPLLAATISATFTARHLMMLAAALALVCALAYAVLQFPAAREARGFSWREAAQVVRYPGLMLFGLLLFCQSGNEASISGWVSTYVGTMGAGARAATWVLAAYWAAMMLGRVIAARLLARIGKGRLVLLSGLGSAAGCLALVLAKSNAPLAAAAVLTGISFAGIYPTVLAMIGDRYSRYAGTVFGVLFGIALVGGMIFPWAIGQVSQSVGVRYGMVIPLLGAIAICALVTRVSHKEPIAAATPADAPPR